MILEQLPGHLKQIHDKMLNDPVAGQQYMLQEHDQWYKRVFCTVNMMPLA